MANIKNLPEDLQGLKNFPCNGSRYYYKEGKDGQKLLVAILFGKSHFIIRFPAGTTIDTVPADSVGSSQIKDGSVKLEDLSDEVKQKLNPEGGEEYSDNGDIDDMFDDNTASTQPTVPTQPLTVEEEEEP